MPGFSFASLRVRLTLLVLLAVLPALALTFYNAEQARQRAVTEAQASAQRLTRLTASNVAQFVEGARQLLVALSRFDRVRNRDGAGCNALLWADSERGRGPTVTAIRTGQPVVARDILTDPAFAPWREQALKRGYASSITLPLLANGQTLGALTIHAAEPDAFQAEEVKLLTELANDLAYGIETLH